MNDTRGFCLERDTCENDFVMGNDGILALNCLDLDHEVACISKICIVVSFSF